MSDPLWTEMLAITNVILFGSLAALELKMIRERQVPVWLHILFVLIGVYWFVLYLFVVITPAGYLNPVWFGQVFVRPAFTFTGAVMLATVIWRYRTRK